jgi:fructokinase
MLVTCGDALIDFVPATATDGRQGYFPSIGGSCCNIAVALGRLGVRAGFMGGISTDFFGEMLIDGLRRSNVVTRYVARLAFDTTVGFVKLGHGEPQYVFYDEGTAGRRWRRADSPPLGADVRLVHVGSVTLIAPPVADECLALFEAEKGRRLLSVDPNCRPSLVKDESEYRSRMNRILALADIIKLSASDLAFLLPGTEPGTAAERWIRAGACLVIVTHGTKGATAYWRRGAIAVLARKVEVVDTIGAGDSFFAAVLASLDDRGSLTTAGLADLPRSHLETALAFGAEVAAITCGRAGADPPWRHELTARSTIQVQKTTERGY